MALETMGHPGRVVARLSRDDLPLFQPVFDRYGELIAPLWTPRTSSFALRYQDGGRRMNVNSIGEPWAESEIDAAAIGTEWVHLAPLLRGDFPLEFLEALAARGHRISLDGQGLVRVPRLGRLHLDGEFDPRAARSDRGPQAEPGGGRRARRRPLRHPTATRLGIAEILVTSGAGGCDLYLDGDRNHIPARAVAEVQTTGTGDAFMVSYLADRAAGVAPLDAARRASDDGRRHPRGATDGRTRRSVKQQEDDEDEAEDDDRDEPGAGVGAEHAVVARLVAAGFVEVGGVGGFGDFGLDRVFDHRLGDQGAGRGGVLRADVDAAGAAGEQAGVPSAGRSTPACRAMLRIPASRSRPRISAASSRVSAKAIWTDPRPSHRPCRRSPSVRAYGGAGTGRPVRRLFASRAGGAAGAGARRR